MYKIGEFSKLVNVSARMLRHYDEQKIFSPAYSDSESGYRMYTIDQIPQLNQVLLLRDSGFKINEINTALARLNDLAFLEQLLEKKKAESRSAIAAEEKKLQKIEEQLKAIKEENKMIKGTEIDFVVKNSLAALELYKKIFDIEIVEATNYPEGSNEAVFTLYDTRFHMLDENPEYQLFAPTPEQPTTIWFNISVEDIQQTYERALENGCVEVQGITTMMEGAVQNAIFVDPFGYMWMLHQIHQALSFEERIKIIEDEM